jgi:hypothetical protein
MQPIFAPGTYSIRPANGEGNFVSIQQNKLRFRLRWAIARYAQRSVRRLEHKPGRKMRNTRWKETSLLSVKRAVSRATN